MTEEWKVEWEQWESAWPMHAAIGHALGQFGAHASRSKTFQSEVEARGFADGLKTNRQIRDVHVRSGR